MSKESYKEIAHQHIIDCKKYDIPIEDVAFEVMHMAEGYSNEEVLEVFDSLSNDVLMKIHEKIKEFKESGEYYVISSTGVTKDLSCLMKRLSILVQKHNEK